VLNYHKLKFSLSSPSSLPHPFIGSTLRGAFGVSLKKVVCINPSYKCEGCFAKDNCLYYDFYEDKNRAHQYRFDFNLNQYNYDFSLYLFEDATKSLPYVISSIHKMFTEIGIGVKREKFNINKITCDGKTIYEDDSFDLSDVYPQSFEIDEFYDKFTLKFITPLRMKYQGKLLNKKPPLENLLYSIQNRLNEIKRLPKTKLTFTPSYKEVSHQVVFMDQTRRSSRQKTKLQIGGVVGEIKYQDVDENSQILLQLGEIIGVGKQCVFGMGKIEIVV